MGSVGTFERGSGLQKNQLQSRGVPAIHYGQIYTHYGVAASETLSFVSSEDSRKFKRAYPGDVLIATTSENDEDLCKAVAWVGDEPLVFSGDACRFSSNLNARYVSYFLGSTYFHEAKRKYITGTKVRRVSPQALSKIKIPVPPCEVQDEIVRILDTFTKMEAELEAELEARRMQYGHYRSSIFYKVRNAESTRMIALKELGEWGGGGTPSKSVEAYWNGPIPWFSPKDMKQTLLEESQDQISEEAVTARGLTKYGENTILVVARSGILKHTLPVGILATEATVNQDMKALTTSKKIAPRYALYLLQNYAGEILLKCHKAGGSVDSLDTRKFFDFRVPVPPLAEQERIVAILDKFDALVNDISSGLPAEIEARRKQYEYYRDRLLSFEEAK
ncbi:restriction endonuclease subunit S [Actinotignum schaalii]|nr:restriction endonuclease subunit S [Actinotignum schaalii]MDE1536197.1 restriction endonuclease subunit S [Actinotignum schaalii]